MNIFGIDINFGAPQTITPSEEQIDLMNRYDQLLYGDDSEEGQQECQAIADRLRADGIVPEDGANDGLGWIFR